MRLCGIILIFIFSSSLCFSEDQSQVFMDQELYSKALKEINTAYDLALGIKNPETRQTVLDEISGCKDCFKNAYTSNDYEKMQEVLTVFYENLDEILAECNENNLRLSISNCIGKIVADDWKSRED